MDPGHRMSMHLRVRDVDQHTLLLAIGSFYVPSDAPESAYALGPWPDAGTGPRITTPLRRWSQNPREVGRSKFQRNSFAGVGSGRLHQ